MPENKRIAFFCCVATLHLFQNESFNYANGCKNFLKMIIQGLGGSWFLKCISRA